MQTILIVDDEPVLRNLFVLYITAAGYRALEAATAAEAIRLVETVADDIHLAIVDHTLEDRKGSALASELMALRPGTRMLLISGAPEDDVTSELQDGEPVPSFLQKPFSREVLVDTVRRLLTDQSAGTAGTR